MVRVLLLLLLLITALIAWRRRDLRRDMFAGSLFVLPFLGLELFTNDRSIRSITGINWYELGYRFSWAVIVGALAGALYMRFAHRYLTPVIHPRRGLMAWLVLGPIVSIALYFATGKSILFCSLAGLGADTLLILSLQPILIWDTVVAMLGMGGLYLLLYLLFGQILPLHEAASGLQFLGRPLEDFAYVLVFGALWGPPYAALRAINRGDTPYDRHHALPKVVLSAASIFAFVIFGAWVYVHFMIVPRVIAASPAADAMLESLSSPVTIQLDKPIDRKSLEVSILPKINGSLSFEDSYVQRSFVRRIVFTPDTYFQPGTEYTVQISSLRNVLGIGSGEYHYTFRTPSLPKVTSVVPADTQKDVAICGPVTVVLDQVASDVTEVNFAFTPPVTFATALSDDRKTYTLKPVDCLAQNTEYTVAVTRKLTIPNVTLADQDGSATSSTSFTTKGPPGITAVTPQGGGILPSTKEIVVSFSEKMEAIDLGKQVQLNPPINGSWAWRDAQTAVYTFAQALPFDTKYILSFPQGLHDQKGGFIPADASFSFTTIGHVQVSGVSPGRGKTGVSIGAPISLTFDQPVDHASAEQRFSLSPAADGNFTWQNQTMTYHTSLAKDTSYQVSEAAGVHSTIGLDLASTFSSSFATEESVTVLAVSQYYQQRALSCEVASLKMALNYRGIGVSEDDLLNQLPTDTSARNGNTWADPYQVFVGDVNGHQNTTGYGVYAGPIAQLAKNYRQAQSVSGWSVQQLAQAITDGNPVEIWGTAGSAKPDSWTTSEGRQISAWVGEHARLVVGFTGRVENPTAFIINDPIFGRLRWSSAQLRGNWSAFGNMGVEIF